MGDGESADINFMAGNPSQPRFCFAMVENFGI